MLIIKEVVIPAKYLDYADVFLKDSAAKLFKHFGINKYAINLESGEQPLYRLIYSLKLVEFKTLKTYIKTNFANSFIYLLVQVSSQNIHHICLKV